MFVAYLVTIAVLYLVKHCNKHRERLAQSEFELLEAKLQANKAKRRAAAARAKSAPGPSPKKHPNTTQRLETPRQDGNPSGVPAAEPSSGGPGDLTTAGATGRPAPAAHHTEGAQIARGKASAQTRQ